MSIILPVHTISLPSVRSTDPHRASKNVWCSILNITPPLALDLDRLPRRRTHKPHRHIYLPHWKQWRAAPLLCNTHPSSPPTNGLSCLLQLKGRLSGVHKVEGRAAPLRPQGHSGSTETGSDSWRGGILQQWETRGEADIS